MSVRGSRRVPEASPPTHSGSPAKCSGPASGPEVLPHDIKTAINYLRAHMDQEVTMTDLVRSCDAAARTLRKHFKDFLGVSPLGYLRRMRLAALRDELLSTTERRSI